LGARQYGGMPLKLVLGPANAAKAGELLGASAAAAPRGALLVVPTAADAEHYTAELAADGVVFHRVTTFAGLAEEIAVRTGYRARRLTTLQRIRVVRRAIETLELTTVAGSRTTPGFAVAAGALIAELQRSLVTPQRFTAALRAWGRADPRRAAYAEDVGALYTAYTRELQRIGRVDGELFAWRALDRLRAEPGRWGATPVFFYGFDDLLGIERDAIETLHRIVGVEVAVSMTYEPGRSAQLARAGAAENLRAIASEVLTLPGLDEHYAPASRAALHHLERNLFEPGAEPLPAAGAVRLLEAAGERAEAELIAAEAVALLGDGYDPGEIVVVARSLDRQGALLGATLTSYGVPWCSEWRMPLGHTALGRGLLALARCAWLPDAGASELLRYLRTPGVSDRPDVADALEAELRREGLSGAEEARARLGWALGEIDSLRGAADPARELARHARRLLAGPHRGQAAVLSAEEELDARALSALCAALEELTELGERPDPAELMRLLETLELAAGAPPREGAVLLAEPLAIRARRFRAVFVCGLCEGEFPRAAAPEPFLSDERRRELALASGLVLGQREEWLAPERYLFYSAVSRATDRVTLSYRSSDEDGNLMLASPFVADVTALFDDELRDERRRRLLADVTWPLAEAPTEPERARSRAALGPRAPLADGTRQLGESALAHVRHREVVSGSALECFADCPVRWLVEGELRPAAMEPDAEPLRRGTFTHTVLERVIARLGGPVTAETLPAARAILGEVLQAVGEGDALSPGAPDALRAALLARIEADLRRYLAQEAENGCEFVPRGLELRFGFDDDDSLPMLVFGEGDEQVRLRGVIDRVDVDPGGSGRAIVRDYKSGSTRIEHQAGHWRSERRLQVALYMVAVRELLDLEPVAGFYQPLGGRELRARGAYRKGEPVGARVFAGDGREVEELNELLDAALADASALARRIRSGRLEPSPQTCSRDGCRYPGICRSS
jgi:ATP-dependent helicase/DNAse subunit B